MDTLKTPAKIRLTGLLLLTFLLSGGLAGGLLSCTEAQPAGRVAKSSAIKTLPASQQANTMIDSRDGAVYPTITIGTQTWMAENLRYNAPGSLVNPAYPSAAYGRLYNGFLAQSVCPDGWHLPTDAEWIELEVALGMPAAEATDIGWRGKHGTKMKSTSGWLEGENGSNSSGFNGLSSGFHFNEEMPGSERYFDGLRSSAGYWGAMDSTKNKASIRFLGGPLEGVNRFDDNEMTWGLACRCVKD